MGFPTSPADGDIHAEGNRLHRWDATDGAWLFEASPERFDIRKYVALTTTTNTVEDWAPAIQQANDDAAAAGGGTVVIPEGNWHIGSTVEIDSLVTVKGTGLASQLTQIDGTDGGLASRGFAALTGGGTNGGPYRFAIEDLYLLGAKGAAGTGNGISIYGTHYFIKNVAVRGFAGYGLWSEYRSANAYGPVGHPDGWSLESRIHQLTLMDNDAGNMKFRGPHDGYVADLVAVSQNITSGTQPVNVDIEAEGSGVQFSHWHLWGNDCDTVLRSTVPLRGDNIVAEGGDVSQIHLIGLTAGANLQNVHAFGQNVAGQKGIILENCERVALGARVNGCPDGVVEFISSAGGNDVRVVYDQTGVNPVVLGAPDVSDRVELTTPGQTPATSDGAIDIRAYGAIPGVDASAALQAAVTAAEGGSGRVHIPAGDWPMSATVNIGSTVELSGAGKYLTRLKPDPGVLALQVENRSLGARNFNTTSLGAYEMGSRLRDFLITGTNGQNQRGVEFIGGTDHVRMEHVGFFHLDQGMKLAVTGGDESAGDAANVREARFRDVTFNLCGSATLAALEITQPATSTAGDGINQLTFVDCEVTYSRGVGILIEGLSTAEFVRRILFNGLMLHGIDGATTPAAADLMILRGQPQRHPDPRSPHQLVRAGAGLYPPDQQRGHVVGLPPQRQDRGVDSQLCRRRHRCRESPVGRGSTSRMGASSMGTPSASG